jgi:hypothetical protein
MLGVLTIIVLLITALLTSVSWTMINVPLPPITWSRGSDIFFASSFTLLNALNLANIVYVKLHM